MTTTKDDYCLRRFNAFNELKKLEESNEANNVDMYQESTSNEKIWVDAEEYLASKVFYSLKRNNISTDNNFVSQNRSFSSDNTKICMENQQELNCNSLTSEILCNPIDKEQSKWFDKKKRGVHRPSILRRTKKKQDFDTESYAYSNEHDPMNFQESIDYSSNDLFSKFNYDFSNYFNFFPEFVENSEKTHNFLNPVRCTDISKREYDINGNDVNVLEIGNATFSQRDMYYGYNEGHESCIPVHNWTNNRNKLPSSTKERNCTFVSKFCCNYHSEQCIADCKNDDISKQYIPFLNGNTDLSLKSPFANVCHDQKWNEVSSKNSVVSSRNDEPYYSLDFNNRSLSTNEGKNSAPGGNEKIFWDDFLAREFNEKDFESILKDEVRNFSDGFEDSLCDSLLIDFEFLSKFALDKIELSLLMDLTDGSNEQNHQTEGQNKSEANASVTKSNFYIDNQTHVDKEVESRTENKEFQCLSCPLKFSSARSMALHQTSAHGGKYIIRCETCGRLFNRKYQFNRHFVHCGRSKQPFECDICMKKYRHRSSLHQHLKNVHHIQYARAYGTSFTCNICTKKYSKFGALENHIKRHKSI